MNLYVVTECLLATALLAYIWFNGFGKLRRDNFRADIRRIRDELFDFMWENGLDYRTPAYAETRKMLNGILALSRNISVFGILVTVLHYSRRLQYGYEKAPIPIRAENQDLRKKLEYVQVVAVARMFQFLFLEGVIGLCIRFLSRTFGFVQGISKLTESIKQGCSSLLTDAPALERAVCAHAN